MLRKRGTASLQGSHGFLSQRPTALLERHGNASQHVDFLQPRPPTAIPELSYASVEGGLRSGAASARPASVSASPIAEACLARDAENILTNFESPTAVRSANTSALAELVTRTARWPFCPAGRGKLCDSTWPGSRLDLPSSVAPRAAALRVRPHEVLAPCLFPLAAVCVLHDIGDLESGDLLVILVKYLKGYSRGAGTCGPLDGRIDA